MAKENYYQPTFENGPPVNINGTELYSFEVYSSLENAQRDFPDLEINEYSGDDIGDPTYVD